MKMPLISLIIPTYNEAATIGPLLARLETVAQRLSSGHALEVIVVDDSPDDNTARAVDAYRRTDRLPIKLHRRAGRGLATAVLHGFTIAQGDLLAVIDADHSHPPELLVELAAAAGEHDLVIGTRNAGGGRVEEWPAHRKLGSRIVTAMTRPLGVRTSDPMSGYFLLHRRVIDGVTLSPLGYKILLEILVKGKHRSVREIPYVFRNRAVGVSKMNARVTLEYFVHFGKLVWWKVRNT